MINNNYSVQSFSYLDTTHICHPGRYEKSFNHILNTAGSDPFSMGITGVIRVAYGILKCAASAIEYLVQSLQKNSVENACIRLREGRNQVLKGIIESIPFFGCLIINHINYTQEFEIFEEIIKRVKNGNLDEGFALIDRNRVEGISEGDVINVYNRVFKTHKNEATKFIEKAYETNIIEDYLWDPYRFPDKNSVLGFYHSPSRQEKLEYFRQRLLNA